MSNRPSQQKNKVVVKTRSVRGFTIVEVLVALTIFVVAMTIAMSGFVTVLQANNRIGNFISVQTNTELALEQMAREIRTGRAFTSGMSSQLRFTNAQNVDVLYCLSVTNGVGSILRVTGSGAACSGAANAITATDVNVSFLSFLLRPIGSSPNLPPRITTAVTVASIVPQSVILPISLETTVSSRNF